MPTHNLNKKRIAVSVNLKLNALEKSDKKPSALKSYCAITGGKETVEVPNNKNKKLTLQGHSTGRLHPTTETLTGMEDEEGGDKLCWNPRSSCGPELKDVKSTHRSKGGSVRQQRLSHPMSPSVPLLPCKPGNQRLVPGPRKENQLHSVFLPLPRVCCGMCVCSQCMSECVCAHIHT